MIERAYFRSSFASILLTAALGLAPAACSSSSNTKTDGSAGRGGSGGTGGTGGRIAGDASDTSLGGTSGTGGAGGQGGGVNPACQVAGYRNVTAFGSIFDGWNVGYTNTPALTPVPAMDGAPASGTILELDSTQGMPTNGSAKLTIPFDGPGEQLLFAKNFTGINLQHAVVTAQIKLDSGLNTTALNTGVAYLVLKTTAAYNYAPGQSVNLDSTAGFVQLSLNADAPNTAPPFDYDPCDVREIDVEIDTGITGTYTTAVIHIDTISITGPAVDGGTDGTSGDGAAGN